ncbi:unnamed protein product [Prorocentrum cordatum]|uniref:Uncharacterized protein n=1 Tax=Prorocentrum cordatum TaxID=2364126 RepID=A0ABN9T1D1_9DINO|nr:unnamed protein product [Polarella glacialis]
MAGGSAQVTLRSDVRPHGRTLHARTNIKMILPVAQGGAAVAGRLVRRARGSSGRPRGLVAHERVHTISLESSGAPSPCEVVCCLVHRICSIVRACLESNPGERHRRLAESSLDLTPLAGNFAQPGTGCVFFS